ncbi:MAG: serine/threonine protein kinase [Acidobacteria bacterium]|nr:serine/threonine protein kinase [Acidobacteriota bacterium]
MSMPLPAGPDSPTLSVEAPHGGVRLGEVLARRFRIVRLLGKGGMGEVFEADDLELGGKVALQTIRPDLLQDPKFLDRFRREVQLARQVTHPNICRLFDLAHDEAAGRMFFTMELVDGQTLNRYLGWTGRLTPEAALPLATQMARGLAALHECGSVHRDFKPGNVLIAGTRAVITDFGVARAIARRRG